MYHLTIKQGYKSTVEKLRDRDPVSFSEWWSYFVARPLMAFRRQARITPALRERCVRYAIDGGANTNRYSREVIDTAEKTAEYITQGKSQ